MKIEGKGSPYSVSPFITVTFERLSGQRLTMMNGWTVITDHDLRRQKKTDDRTLLSMANIGQWLLRGVEV